MPLNFLLWNCLVPGKTSCAEQRKEATLTRGNDECVLTFSIDNQPFKDRFGVRHACDAMFFYSGRNKGPILLFVELKGDDIEHGAGQLPETLIAVRRELQQKKLDAEYRAVIITSGGAPGKGSSLRKGFLRDHGVPLEVLSRKRGDLRPYL